MPAKSRRSRVGKAKRAHHSERHRREMVGTAQVRLCPPYNSLRLSPQRALRVDIERVDRLARCHEQAVALQSAEAEIGAAFGQGNAADRSAVGCKYHDAVELGHAHAPAAP